MEFNPTFKGLTFLSYFHNLYNADRKGECRNEWNKRAVVEAEV
jgi:hypothetical protein